MGCWGHLPNTWQSWVNIRDGINVEDEEGGLGDGQSSRESQGLGRTGFLLRCHLSEWSPLTLDVQLPSINPLESLPRLPSPRCVSPDCTFIVYLSVYCWSPPLGYKLQTGRDLVSVVIPCIPSAQNRACHAARFSKYI